MMEKRVLIAGILSAIFFAFYAQVVLPKQGPKVSLPGVESSVTEQSSDVNDSPKNGYDDFVPELTAKAASYLENKDLRVEFGLETGAIREVELKKFADASGIGNQVFGGVRSILNVANKTRNLKWQLLEETGSEIHYRVIGNEGSTFKVTYSLRDDAPVIDLNIARLTGNSDTGGEWILASTWEHAGGKKSRYNRLEGHVRYEKSPGAKPKYKKFGGPLKQVKDVPRGTLMMTLAEGFFCQSVDFGKERPKVELLSPAENQMSAIASLTIGQTYSASIYVGPRDFFYMRDAGFKDGFKIGLVGQLGLMLLALLSGIASITHNYGVAIIFFSAVITGLLAPFTLMSYRSMRKMQELQPQMQKIMDKHKDDPTKANQHVFALYKEHKVSPVSGCLPMLLQWPILIALFQGITHFIELRGESFLWIKDLSQPDRLAMLPTTLPVLGDAFNLLPLLMAGAMFLQTKANSKSMPAAQNNPTAQFMQGPIFPLIFALMLYNSPSGLILYWMMNSLLAMLLYRFARK